MRRIYFAFGALAMLGFVGQAQAAGDAAAGKAKTQVCQGCHGEKFLGDGPIPRLAGQTEPYVVEQLNAFKSGSRDNPMMSPNAANLSDQDIADIAAYLSSLK